MSIRIDPPELTPSDPPEVVEQEWTRIEVSSGEETRAYGRIEEHLLYDYGLLHDATIMRLGNPSRIKVTIEAVE